MIGQGRPHSSPITPARTRDMISCIAPVLVAVLFCNSGIAGPLSMRVRIEWWGDQRVWQGRISSKDSLFSDVRPLGISADEAATIVTDGPAIQIRAEATRSYDGLEATLECHDESRIQVQLTSSEAPSITKTVEIPVSDIFTSTQSLSLDDDNGNRLLIRRAPGDRLRVSFSRDHLVFQSGELFRFDVAPHLTGITVGTPLRCKTSLVVARGDDAIWTKEDDLRVDERGEIEPIQGIEIPLSVQEGVYDVVLSLSRRGLKTPFAKPLLGRRMQIVVLEEEEPDATQPGNFELIREIDPVQPRWWERLRLPQWGLIPGFAQGPIYNEKPVAWDHGGKRWSLLPADGWLAFPIPIDGPGRPHLLEIDYPADVEQTLGISIVEPDAAGNIDPLGLDSGVSITDELVVDSPTTGVLRHRLVFWPRSESPLLLLTSRGKDTSAVYGTVRVSLVQGRLPSRFKLSESGRLVAGYFQRPWFPETFLATKALQIESSDRTLEDWITFYQGGQRLIEYLQYAGYSGVSVGVAADGSAIYPSNTLNPSPKFDRGSFFASGQDVVRKDVVELLFRLCDRSRIQLIPAVQFASPLPALERLLNASTIDATGVSLVDEEGKSWFERYNFQGGRAPRYNPLDSRVQNAMANVLKEFVRRYASHSSFGGVMLCLVPDGFLQMPGPTWGLDDTTLTRFSKEVQLGPEWLALSRDQQRQQIARGDVRERWLLWRVETLHRFHERLSAIIRSSSPDSRLFISTSELVNAIPLKESLRPVLRKKPSVETALIDMGLSPSQYANSDIVFLRPQRTAPLSSIEQQAVHFELNHSAEVDRLFDSPHSGVLFFHEPQTLRLESFDPFGRNKTNLTLISQMPPAGQYNRRRFVHGIATSDVQHIFDGGWQLPMGQEESTADLFASYQQLPKQRFHTVTLSDETLDPLVVRTLATKGQTYIYIVNDSSWRTTVDLSLSAPAHTTLRQIGNETVTRLKPSLTGQGSNWSIELKPYDFIAAIIDQANLRVTNIVKSTPDSVQATLGNRLGQVKARAVAIKHPRPLSVLLNPSFEQATASGQPDDWIVSDALKTQIKVVADTKHHGKKALHMTSDGPNAWVRSRAIRPPKSGRIWVSAFLRTSNTIPQLPELRLSVEGQVGDRSYYRFATFGNFDGLPSLQDEWNQYIFPVEDMPLERLQQLRIGFDLIGAGQVWIDELQLFDVPCTDDEHKALDKRIALADFQLGNGRLGACARTLESYWLRFLVDNVNLDATKVAQRPATPLKNRSQRTEKEPTFLDKMRGLLPSMPRFY